MARGWDKSQGISSDLDLVNDEYCDCSDGSDEPGTFAHGGCYGVRVSGLLSVVVWVFHCTHAGTLSKQTLHCIPVIIELRHGF